MPPSNPALVSHTRRMYPERGYRLRYRTPAPIGGESSNPKEKAIDDLIRGVFLDFDFTPVFSGDNLRARLVATDLYNELIARARISASLKDALFTEQEVMLRWESLVNKQIESIMAFRRRFAGLLSKKRQN